MHREYCFSLCVNAGTTMKTFEIKVSHNGTVYHLLVEPCQEGNGYNIYYDGVLLTILWNDGTKNEEYWSSAEPIAKEFVNKIGNRISNMVIAV